MLAPADLTALARRHDGVRTLSAYIPIPRGTPHNVVRTLLRQGIARAREGLAYASHIERTNFDACADRLLARAASVAQPSPDGATWVGIAGENGATYDEWVSRVLPLSIAWEPRLRIAPYLAALTRRGALAVVVDRKHAAFYRCIEGSLVELERWETDATVHTGPHMSAPPSPGFHRGTGGLPGADAAERQRDAAARRHVTRVVERIRTLDTHGEWIVLCGAAEAVHHVARVLPREAVARVAMAESVTATSTPAQIRAAIKPAVATLRQAHEARLVATVQRAGAVPRRVVTGRVAIDALLDQRAARALVIATTWLERDAGAIEDVVRRALDQDADVEFVSGDAAVTLETFAGGIAAELRFAATPSDALYAVSESGTVN